MTQAIKNAYQDLAQNFAETRWGSWEVLGAMATPSIAVCVKKITVLPAKALSFQRHTGREEYWKVLSGSAHVVLGTSQADAVFKTIIAGETAYIPQGMWHALMNASTSETLVIQEIQSGALLDESDIERDGEPVITNGHLSFIPLAV